MNTELHLVLVRPQYPRNVGYCARAMGNMGGSQLHIIAPDCDLNDEWTRMAAAGHQEALQQAIIYQDWNEFLENNSKGLRIAMTARSGKDRASENLDILLEDLNQKSPELIQENSIYLFMGPEDHGLSTDDIDKLHYCAKIPTFGKFTSLNLGHAALLAMFISQQFKTKLKPLEIKETQEKDTYSLAFPHEAVKTWLESVGFHLDSPKRNMSRTFSNLLLRAVPTDEEIRALEKIIYQNIRKLKEKLEK